SSAPPSPSSCSWLARPPPPCRERPWASASSFSWRCLPGGRSDQLGCYPSSLTLLTFASPILYPETILGPAARSLLAWNPFTHLLRLYRIPLEGGGRV